MSRPALGLVLLASSNGYNAPWRSTPGASSTWPLASTAPSLESAMDVAVDSQSLSRMQARLTLTVRLPIGTFIASLMTIVVCVILAPGQVVGVGIDQRRLPQPLHSLRSVTPEWKDWDSHFKVVGGLPRSW